MYNNKTKARAVASKRTRSESPANETTMQRGTESCARCLLRISCLPAAGRPLEELLVKVRQCGQCQRWFHAKCYLMDIGLSKEERCKKLVPRKDSVTCTAPCVICLSRIYQPAQFCNSTPYDTVPRGWLRYRRTFDERAWSLAASFLQNGYVAFPLSWAVGVTDVMDLESRSSEIQMKLTALQVRTNKYFSALLNSYERRLSHAEATGSSIVPLETGFSNFRMRCGGRYEIVAPLLEETMLPCIEDSLVLQVIQICLQSESPKKMSSGCFLSVPGAAGQNVHTDGPLLSDSETLFPYAINCFVPLVEISNANGTEFYPQTQLHSTSTDNSTLKTLQKESPQVRFGNVLLFDYRVLHRGLPNRTRCNRPCAYVTYAQPWYTDTYNFGSERYRSALEISDGLLESRAERHAKRQQGKDEPIEEGNRDEAPK